jgi:hypothetical protein
MLVCPFRLIGKAPSDLPQWFCDQHVRGKEIPSDLQCIGQWCTLFQISDEDLKNLEIDKGRCALEGPRPADLRPGR